MKIEDVPQDRGMITDDRREICYAVDDQGSYVMTGSAGWEPKNIANRQAWDLIDAAAAKAMDKVRDGKASPLAYHMAMAGAGDTLRVIEPDPTYELAAAPRSAGGVRLMHSLPENIEMSRYGRTVYRDFARLMDVDGEPGTFAFTWATKRSTVCPRVIASCMTGQMTSRASSTWHGTAAPVSSLMAMSFAFIPAGTSILTSATSSRSYGSELNAVSQIASSPASDMSICDTTVFSDRRAMSPARVSISE